MPILPVDDPDDPRLADYRAVPDPVLLRQRGLFAAESRLVVRELLTHPRLRTRSLLLTEAALASLGDLLSAPDDPRPIYVGSQALLKRVIGYSVHRGSLALGERPAPVTDRRLPALATARLVLALEQVGNPDNVGSIFRNAAAFGAGCVLLTPDCADPLYRKAIRTSLGATLRVPYAELDDWPASLDRLRALGYVTVALTPDASAEPLEALAADPPTRVALVLGTEGAGLSDRAVDAVDRRARIPIADGVDSLNVATATGIALYRLATVSPARHPPGVS